MVMDNDKRNLYRFFVPFVNNHGQEISKEKRDDFINVVEKESCNLNGGFTAFEARGGYVNRDGKLIREVITVIETYGVNPLPPERIAHCRKYLSQESLVIMEGQSFEFIDYKRGVDLTNYKLPNTIKEDDKLKSSEDSQ